MPHLCIRNELNQKPETFEGLLNLKVHKYIISNQLLKAEKDKEAEAYPNVLNRMKKDYSYVLVEEFRAQDIMNYDESGSENSSHVGAAVSRNSYFLYFGSSFFALAKIILFLELL